MRKAIPAMALALAALAPACGSSQKNAASAEQAQYAHQVPAGSQFRVRLNTAVGTDSTAGQPFTASLVTPLQSATGQTVVSPGAMINGRVVGVDHGATASVQLVFTSIDAGQGPAPLAATVRNTNKPQAAYSAEEIYAQGLPYSAVLLPAKPSGSATPPVGGGPTPPSNSAPGTPPGQPSDPAQSAVNLPVGASLEMVLTRPLTYPATPDKNGSSSDTNQQH